MKKLFTAMIPFLLALAACSSAGSTPAATVPLPTAESSIAPTATEVPPTEEATKSTGDTGPTVEPTRAQATDEADKATAEASDLPVWMTIEMTDIRTGEIFKLADFIGKTVYFEHFATFSPDSEKQMEAVREVFDQIGSGNFVFVSVTLEDIPNRRIISFLDRHGGIWHIAKVGPDVQIALQKDFTTQITAAALVPFFVIRPDGTHTDVMTRPRPAEEILALLQAVDKGEQ